MDPHAGKIVLNGAPSQLDRWLEALGPEYAKPDGRTFQQLLDFATKYGSLIRFYNLEDTPDGDWAPFFLSDTTLILAAVDDLHPAEREATFEQSARRTREARSFHEKFDRLRDTFGVVLDLAREVDRWLTGLDLNLENPVSRVLRTQIASAIGADLGAALRRLKACDEGAGLPWALDRPIGLDYTGFSPIWNLMTVVPDGEIYQGSTPGRKIDHALPGLSRIFMAFLNGVTSWKPFAQANFSDTLDSGRHKPHLALYIAFAKLFGYAQDTLNTFSDRYRDFYYRDLLREKPAGPIPDQVYLTFTLAEDENVRSTTIPRDTLFPAGQDADGRELLYGSDKALAVTAARLSLLRAVRVLETPSGNGGQKTALLNERRVMSTEIRTGEEVQAGTSWPTFGAAEPGTTESCVTIPSALGFAIASDTLRLESGERRITLTVTYPRAFKAELNRRLDPLATATGLPRDIVLRRVLEKAFTLYLSVAEGWLRVEAYDIPLIPPTTPPNDPFFKLEFTLTESAPPIVPYTPEEEPPEPPNDENAAETVNPAPSLPTLKAYLDQTNQVELTGDKGTAFVWPLTILDGLPIASLRLNVHVTGLIPLELANPDGTIDPSSPFLPFGGVPTVGSYLLFRSPELFLKRIETFSFQLDWFNLPPNETGFAGYYRDYTLGLDGLPQPDLFDNQSFKGTIKVVNPGIWTLAELSDGSTTPYLFRTLNDCAAPEPTRDGKLCSDTLFDGFTVQENQPPHYYDPNLSGIRLELAEPPYAFGNDLYPKNVLNAVIEDLPDTETCQQKCLNLCQPLQEAEILIQTCLGCLAGCTGKNGPDPACVNACLKTCLDGLLALSTKCLEGCPEKNAFKAVATLLPGVLERPDRAAEIRRIRSMLVSASATGPTVTPVLSPCQVLVETLSCVSDCEQAWQVNHDLTVLETCLTECLKTLAAAYAGCLQSCMEQCMSPQKDLKYPNEPYLPQAVRLTVIYSATNTVVPKSTGGAEFFHLLPFGGYNRISATDAPLIPTFSNEGNLYFGFSSLMPPQTLTLLFQMTAEVFESDSLPPIGWDYLADNRWHPLGPTRIFADTTEGLKNSGLATLSLPVWNPAGNTILPSQNQWLRATARDHAGGFPKSVSITPHAVLASWRSIDATGEHLRQPLPAGTITSSVEDLPDISAIAQPMPSFGGRAPETGRDFIIRLAERLRHKDRAILDWDYEHLVLERFPTIWKVQALPARSPAKGRNPGHVLVVVVPGPDGISVMSPTVPAAPSEMLNQIEQYLAERATPFATIHVVNPVYVRIKVIAAIRFRDETDTGANVKRMNDDLTGYLSPWFYDAERTARQGNYASEADMTEFIQTRPYVAAVETLEFEYSPADRSALEWYFLTSADAHDITDAGFRMIEARPGY